VRVVLDTNVLVSAFLFPGGRPEAAYRLVLEGAVQLVTSRPLLAEFGDVLQRKFEWEADLAEAAVAQLIRIAEIVEPEERLAVVSADPSDDRVLEAAVAGRATVIVSGDRHLLGLGVWAGIPILDAATFVSRVENG
jgi:uncharacterized protein